MVDAAIVGQKIPDFEMEFFDGKKQNFLEWAGGSPCLVDFYTSW